MEREGDLLRCGARPGIAGGCVLLPGHDGPHRFNLRDDGEIVPRGAIVEALRGAEFYLGTVLVHGPCPACDPSREGREVAGEVLSQVREALVKLDEEPRRVIAGSEFSRDGRERIPVPPTRFRGTTLPPGG